MTTTESRWQTGHEIVCFQFTKSEPMKTPDPEPTDPWDRIPDQDRIRYEEMPPQPDPDKFTGGEIAICLVFIIGVLGGIGIGAYKIISMWLELP